MQDIKKIGSEKSAGFFAFTDKGLSQLAFREVRELAGEDSNAKVLCGEAVSFSADYSSALRFLYLAQSIKRCTIAVACCKITRNLEESKASVLSAISSFDFSFLGSESFVVECDRNGEHDFASVDIAREIEAYIIGKTGAVVEFRNPKYTFFAQVEGELLFLGLDLSGFDLSKREYKVFNHPNSLKGTVAYALFREGLDSSKEKSSPAVLNPFCRSGVISIEGAFFLTHFSINFFRKDAFSCLNFGFSSFDCPEVFAKCDAEAKKNDDFRIFSSDPDMRHLASAKKNAKIAGVEKKILFSRNDLEWLDIRFGEKKISAIISDLSFGKETDVRKIFREFFNQCDYLLSPGGSVSVVCRDYPALKEFIDSFGFEAVEHRRVFQGKLELDFYMIKRRAAK
jgi:23S rRNA G2445 N2-methylase RlmL